MPDDPDMDFTGSLNPFDDIDDSQGQEGYLGYFEGKNHKNNENSKNNKNLAFLSEGTGNFEHINFDYEEEEPGINRAVLNVQKLVYINP